MNYATQANRPNPAAMLGALGVPAGFGAILIAGLAVTAIITPPMPNPTAITIRPVPIDPPPPPPEPSPSSNSAQTPANQQTNPVDLTAPISPIDLGPTGPIATLPDFTGGPIGPVDIRIDPPAPPPAPMPDPIAASPRGNPGGWVTDSDYRSNWIRRELSGRASFALEISASGKVSNCAITRSSGHAILDNATCKLITQRARFNPAKDSSGKAVAGTYSSAIMWELP